MPVRLNGSTSGYTELSAPAVAGSNTLTLPTGNGTSGQFLQTNGSGALSWAGGGKILQVVSTTKTDTFSSATTGSWLDVTGLSANITPSTSSNKILIFGRITGAGTNAVTRMQMRLVRDTTAISIGDAASNRLQVSGNELYTTDTDMYLGSTIFFLDSPATSSQVTYKLQVRNGDSGGTIYVNRSAGDADTALRPRGTSSITVMEVAA